MALKTAINGNRPGWAAAVLVVLLLASPVLVPDGVRPSSAGIVGQTRGGCTCHNVSEALSVTPSIEGLPGSYEPGEVYDLSLSFDGGPSRGPGARAGFDLKASAGQLLVPEGSLQVRIDPSTGEVSHTLEGNNATLWAVRWRAPAEDTGTVTLTLVVNAVNGDRIQGPGDQWGRVETEVQEGDRSGVGDASPFWVVLGVGAVVVIVGLAWYVSRGPRVERR